MLDHLRVANLGVLEDASIDPSGGFTVITGETGAGKTLLLGGLRLILGGAADSSAVGPSADHAQVDGLFVTSGGELGVSRTVPREGRSRAHLEGAIVSTGVLAEKLGSMVEIVGQHDQLSITHASNLLGLVDGSHDAEGRRAKEDYERAWVGLQEILDRQRRLGGDQIELARELDLARYQVSEIAGAGLSAGLDEELEASVSRLRNVEEITEHLAETMRLAEQTSDSVGEMVARLRKAAGLDSSLVELASDADGLAAVIAEIARETRSSVDGRDADPARLADLEERLTALGDLKRKYGRTLLEVIGFGEETAERVSELETMITDAGRIDGLLEEARLKVQERSGTLSEARRAIANQVSKEMLGHLGDLGLGSATVDIEVSEVEAGRSGADRVEMRFASDSRLEAGPVASVASGGELSRLVLALRLATRSEDTTTLVFDEVDTGIGGKTALAMGQKLAELAKATQVLCVTHLPHVAAHADTHYVVERGDDGLARVRRVDGDQRVTEISRMLAGQPESAAGRSAASELLSIVDK